MLSKNNHGYVYAQKIICTRICNFLGVCKNLKNFQHVNFIIFLISKIQYLKKNKFSHFCSTYFYFVKSYKLEREDEFCEFSKSGFFHFFKSNKLTQFVVYSIEFISKATFRDLDFDITRFI